MGITRDSRHKRRLTGGKRSQHFKKHNYEMGRPAAMTKLGAKRIHVVRTRGGNSKFRALRLETGNFAWASETTTRKTRVVDVVYNATSNELVRTKTLVKGSIIQIDATPYRQYYEAHYGLPLGKKRQESKKKEDKTKKTEGDAKVQEETKKKSRHVIKKIAARKESSKVDPQLIDQFSTGRLYARITSRPGQSGRCDGYILEGHELAFYLRKLKSKKGA